MPGTYSEYTFIYWAHIWHIFENIPLSESNCQAYNFAMWVALFHKFEMTVILIIIYNVRLGTGCPILT